VWFCALPRSWSTKTQRHHAERPQMRIEARKGSGQGESLGLKNTPRTPSSARCRICAGHSGVAFGLRVRGPLAFRARRPAPPVFHAAVLLTVCGRSAVALPRRGPRRDPRRCPVCPGLWFAIREAYRKPRLRLRPGALRNGPRRTPRRVTPTPVASLIPSAAPRVSRRDSRAISSATSSATVPGRRRATPENQRPSAPGFPTTAKSPSERS